MNTNSCGPNSLSHNKKSGESKEKLKWWQLSLIGVGCTIGTGYFLGSSIGITLTGPSIVFSFLLAALGTYIVFHLLAKMTVKDPQQGSFCYYARKAFGQWAGFSCGWNYWCSNILIMGSQLIALSILSQFWLPNVPLWIFASGYSVLSILIVLTGTKGFDKMENIFAILKFAAIWMFIILAIAVLFGWINGNGKQPGFPHSIHSLFTDGYKGFWSSLMYAYYAFGGIEVIGIMAMQLKKKTEAPKSGRIMLVGLTIIYVLSLGLAILLVTVGEFNEKESPFVTALRDYHLPFFPHVFNGAIIIAGFSTMTAALYGVITLLVTLANEGDAPSLFSKKVKKLKSLPIASLGLASIGLIVSIVTALLLPEKIYEYMTTAAGILLLYNWFFIIISAFRNLTLTLWNKFLAAVGLFLIVAAISGTLVEKEIRPGFFVSLPFVCLILLVFFIMQKVRKKKKRTIRYY